MYYSIKNFGAATFMLLSFTILGTSCEWFRKDDLQDHIVGEWNITSFRVDGQELKGSVITKSVMEFDEYEKSKGDFDWTISYADGTSDFESGYYEIDLDDETLTIKSNDGESLEFDLEIEDDELEFSGLVDGQNFQVKAEKED